MRLFLLGSGGREAALAWRFAASRSVSELVAGPGNPGIARHAELVDVDPAAPAVVVEAARRVAADLVVVGPEAPLVAGVADALRDAGIPVFGPGATAARIEGSKAFAKHVMEAAGIPTASAQVCSSTPEAEAALDRFGPPYVVKADGLAAGKGVVVTEVRAEALAAIADRIERRRFGDAGASVVIEEYLDGPEVSLIGLSDGRTVLPLEPAQDYKRLLDSDAGPNTGGMGSYSPVPACPGGIAEEIAAHVLEPAIRYLGSRGSPFSGALYAGLALTSSGPKVIEFNARFGDPETQALVPRLKTDLGELCAACASGDLAGATLEWDPSPCVTVVLAAAGYPESPRVGDAIQGLERATEQEGARIFHAGTARAPDGSITVAGGRVLSVSATGAGFTEARRRAYEVASMIEFPGIQMRSDIALRAERSEGRQPSPQP